QPDGKILIGGNFSSYNGTNVSKLARLNADGTLDSSFNPGAGPNGGFVRELLVQPDGKILVAGWFSSFSGFVRNGVLRLNADGGYDSTFNPGDSVDAFNVETIALQPDGKVLVGGIFYTDRMPSGNSSAITRLNPNGTVDPTFTAPAYGPLYLTAAIVVQPDGKLILGGNFHQGSFFSDAFPWLDRRNADGTGDATFIRTIPSFPNSGVNRAIMQGDGKILFGGQFAQSAFNSNYKYLLRAFGDMFVTWNAGNTADKTVSLSIAGDTSHEENETVALKLESFTDGAAVEPIQNATLTILDNDPLVGFAAATYSLNENAGTVSIPVERVGWTQNQVTVFYVATSGTAGSGDYTYPGTPVVFAPGETTKNLTFDLTDDAVNERDESFYFQITGITGGGVLSRGRTDITILNDDPLPTVSIADTSVVEGDSGTKQALFTVTRSGLIDRNVTVNYRTVDGTAAAGEDYVPVGNQFVTQLQIAPNVTSGTVAVSVFGDTIIEPNKTFSVELSSPVNATVTRAKADGEIQDNDTTTGVPTVQFNAREFRAQEGAGIATLNVTRSGDASAPTNVTYATTLWVNVPPTGSAWDRNDYTFASGTLRFAAGETSKTIQVFVADDALVEGDETLTV
ncbi:MAG TPA: Calx-beta domain-containing protein, partial [Pyrinomonadaceae bacterium]